MCFLSQPPAGVDKVVKTFGESVLATKQLLMSGLIEKIWVLGGQRIYQVFGVQQFIRPTKSQVF